MKQTALSIDLEHYDDIVRSIADLAQDSFKNLNIAKDAVNYALLSLLKAPPSADSPVSQAQLVYPKVIEELFTAYRMAAFQYCLQRTRNPELSNDIAQETICCLLKSQNRINEIANWVRKVAHNLLCEHYRAKKDEQALYRDLHAEGELISQTLDNATKTGLEEYLHVIPESVFQGPNYKSYLQLKEYDSLKAYAKANNIAYETAKSRSRKILRDLKAEILLALGWEDSPDILDYNQYRVIQHFIRKLLALSIATDEESNKALAKLHPDLPEVLSGYKSIEDWGITMISELRYRLILFHLSPEEGPLASTIFITIDKRKHVEVESCIRNQFVAQRNIPDNILIPKERGRSLWPYEKIISCLNENSR